MAGSWLPISECFELECDQGSQPADHQRHEYCYGFCLALALFITELFYFGIIIFTHIHIHIYTYIIQKEKTGGVIDMRVHERIHVKIHECVNYTSRRV